MTHREERHGEIVILDGVEHIEVSLYGGIIIVVSDHHTLGLSGRAGGVDKGGDIFAPRLVDVLIHKGLNLSRGIHAESYEVIPEDGHRVIGFELKAIVLENDDFLDIGIALPVAIGQGILMRISYEDEASAAILDDEIELRLAAVRIYGDASEAIAVSAELGDEYLRRIGRANSNSILGVE